MHEFQPLTKYIKMYNMSFEAKVSQLLTDGELQYRSLVLPIACLPICCLIGYGLKIKQKNTIDHTDVCSFF